MDCSPSDGIDCICSLDTSRENLGQFFCRCDRFISERRIYGQDYPYCCVISCSSTHIECYGIVLSESHGLQNITGSGELVSNCGIGFLRRHKVCKHCLTSKEHNEYGNCYF